MKKRSKGVIVATLGPASDKREILEKMVEEGLDVVRLNLSHGTHKDHKKRFELVRSVNDTIPILFDLSGPKIRIGMLEKSITLKSGYQYTLTKDDIIGDQHRASLLYDELIDVAKVGNTLFLNDGLLEFKITEKTENELICEVITGGILSSRKGVNTPGVPINLYAPTPKDLDDLDFTIGLEPDFYSVSFVRRVEDLERVRARIKTHTDDRIPLISKIEHQDALKNIDDIIKKSDGIMVARGDLGIELPLDQIPRIQKELIDKCQYYSTSCIVATQMLESMIKSPRPTRAEVSDVANAIIQGSDAVMLSAETATGNYPIDTIRVMDKIISTAQEDVKTISDLTRIRQSTTAESICRAATGIATTLKADKIIAYTRSGITSGILSRFKPEQEIIAISPNVKTTRRCKLQWGVTPLLIERDYFNTDEMVFEGLLKAYAEKRIKKDTRIVVVAGSIVGQPSPITNLIQVVNTSDILSEEMMKIKFTRRLSQQ